MRFLPGGAGVHEDRVVGQLRDLGWQERQSDPKEDERPHPGAGPVGHIGQTQTTA